MELIRGPERPKYIFYMFVVCVCGCVWVGGWVGGGAAKTFCFIHPKGGYTPDALTWPHFISQEVHPIMQPSLYQKQVLF